MQNWLLPLFLIKFLALLGIFLCLLYLRPWHAQKGISRSDMDKSYNMLAAFTLVAFFSFALFIFVVLSGGTP
jgi:hypothetical protein